MCEIEREIINNYRNETRHCMAHMEKVNFRYFVISLLSLLTVICITGMFLLYLYQYDYGYESETLTIDQESADGGNVSYIGGNYNGEATN